MSWLIGSIIFRERFASVWTWRLVRATLWVSAISVTALACGWMGIERSIRFRGTADFNWVMRLPSLPTRIDSATGRPERTPIWDDGDPRADKGEERVRQTRDLFAGVEPAETNSEWKRARDLLNSYLRRTAIERDSVFFQPEQRQQSRNSAFDQLDAITMLDTGASPEAVRAYLDARRAFDQWAAQGSQLHSALEEALATKLNKVPRKRGIDANIAYLKAAILYKLERYEEAVPSFGEVSAHYPGSPKREAAMYMRALSLMKLSDTYSSTGNDAATSGDEAHVQASRHEAVPQPKERDSYWYRATDAFGRFVREYPRGRYLNDARGWLAYLKLRAGDRVGALLDYYRLLNESDADVRTRTVFSLTLVRHHATDDQLDILESRLEKEPSVALAYAYHSIYNYAIDPGCPMRELSDRYAEQEGKKRDQGQKELARMARFTTKLMRRYPNMAFGPGFCIRAAEANLESGNSQSALDLATRAIAAGARGGERDQALWVKAVAEDRIGRFQAARATLHALIRENPGDEMLKGARKVLALVEEDAGNYEAALEQYLLLDYQVDAAYLVDVLMPPEDLAHFIEVHPDMRCKDVLLYSLGLRYLRKGKWAEARRAFTQVHTCADPQEEYTLRPGYPSAGSQIARISRLSPKVTYHQSSIYSGVHKSWLVQDLATLGDLERLDSDVRSASGDEARAEALYRLASYQYDGSTLMYYNPWAWGGSRMENLEFLDFAGYRARSEAGTVWEYFQAHEPVVHALAIYLQIVDLYPNSRVAPLSLYTAAVCHERLANYDEYWHKAYEKGQHAGVRLVTYSEVRARYPRFQLPKGTIGWEPSNGTVNGGPALAAPPKPPIRVPLRQRLARMAWDRAQHAWNSAVIFTVNAVRFVFSMLFLTLVALIWWFMISSKRKLIAEVRSCTGIHRAPLPPCRREGARMGKWKRQPRFLLPWLSPLTSPSILSRLSRPRDAKPSEDGYAPLPCNSTLDKCILAARSRLRAIANCQFNSARGLVLVIQGFACVLTLALAIAILLAL